MGLMGVDFGHHWDEIHPLSLVQQYARTGDFMPGWYEWPPMVSYVAFAATVPYSLPYQLADYPDYHIRDTVQRLVLDDPTFILNARRVLIAVVYLAPVWVLLAAFKLEARLGQAVIAALLLALSWEVNYHSRFIAPDALLLQFGALTLLFVSLAYSSKRYPVLWLLLAAVTAALGAASKYPGALLVLPVVVVAWKMAADKSRPFARFLVYTLLVALVSALAFSLVVPGILLEQEQFWGTISNQIGHYAGGHGRQTVEAGLPHLSLMLGYFSTVFWSPYPIVSMGLFALLFFGIGDLARRRQWILLLLLTIFPVFYIALFSRQSVMFVRNILVVTPFLAVLAARGAASIYEMLPHGLLRKAAPAALAVVFILNAWYLWQAANSIVQRGTDAYAREFVAYAVSHPAELIYVSPETLQQVNSLDLPPNLVFDFAQAPDKLAIMYYEAMATPGYWWVNRLGSGPETFGPKEINLDYYAFWRGDDRILLVSPQQATKLEFKPEFIP